MKIFPEGSIIPSNRRLRNIGEILKPTIPNRFPQHGPPQEKGFFKCTRCDLCKHVPQNTKSFRSPWDGRRWQIRTRITCTSDNVVYLIICTLHDNYWYVGSSDNVRRRWTKHKYDWTMATEPVPWLIMGKMCHTQMIHNWIMLQSFP